MISHKKYIEIRDSNTKQFKKDRANGKRHFTSHKYRYACGSYYDAIAEGGNQSDFSGAIAIGAVPYKKSHGVDAILLINGKLVDIEVKTTTVSSSKFWQTKKGTLYSGCGGTNVTGLKSSIEACYTIGNSANRRTKYIPTYLVIFESEHGCIVDAIKLGSNKIKQIFRQKKKNKARTTNGKIAIKLYKFLELGNKTKTTIAKLGFKQFQGILRSTCESTTKSSGPVVNSFNHIKYKKMIKRQLCLK